MNEVESHPVIAWKVRSDGRDHEGFSLLYLPSSKCPYMLLEVTMITTATGRQCLSPKQSVCPHQHLLHVRLCKCLLPHELLLKLTHPHLVGNSQHPFIFKPSTDNKQFIRSSPFNQFIWKKLSKVHIVFSEGKKVVPIFGKRDNPIFNRITLHIGCLLPVRFSLVKFWWNLTNICRM